MVNTSESIAWDFQEFNDFILQYSHLMITNRVRQTSQFLMVLLDYIKGQLDILSLEHLSPRAVASGRLKELLLKMKIELPHHLQLPRNPTKELWKYNSTLSCPTFLEDIGVGTETIIRCKGVRLRYIR